MGVFARLFRRHTPPSTYALLHGYDDESICAQDFPATPDAAHPADPRRPLPPYPTLSSFPTFVKAQQACLCLALVVIVALVFLFDDQLTRDAGWAASCTACFALLAPLKQLAHFGDGPFTDICTEFCTELNIQDPVVCFGAVGTQAPILAHVLRAVDADSLAMNSFCSTIFGMCRLPETVPFTVPLPPEIELGVNTSTAARLNSSDREPFQVVHISDVHVDRDYLTGSEADCDEVLCCRSYGPHSLGNNVTFPAGLYGHPNCDTPPALEASMFDAVKRIAPNASFSIFTGDVDDSAVWEAFKPKVSNRLHTFYGEMPAVSYPVIGNHDVAPVNGFPRSTSPNASQVDWVYDVAARDWEKWIGSEAAQQVRNSSGCYSRVHPGTSLRIISINTNLWYKQDFWLYETDEHSWDPNGILTWLASELDFAEKSGQRAWIIGHMSFGKTDTMRDQSNYANQIFRRYRKTIAAQFYGHSHKDELEISYLDYDDRRADTATGIAFISGALTPRGGNPVFRVYDVDPVTYDVLDFRPYRVNMDADLFQTGPLDWEELYSARDKYGGFLNESLASDYPLNGTFWHLVTEAMERDDNAFQFYMGNLARGAWSDQCHDEKCKKDRICAIRAMQSESNCGTVPMEISFRPTPHRAVPLPNSTQHPKRSLHRRAELNKCEPPGLATFLGQVGAGSDVRLPRLYAVNI
ncbi:PPN1 endopolyphosphatase family protein [Rhodotorula paludigena]|uniref:PPN1 endopolyphosphatase family protein n=1 Tax=Rhodotorula paludigena TaxID=86838 RepID=UPI00318224A1